MASLRKRPHEWYLMSGFVNGFIAHCANSLILADSNKLAVQSCLIITPRAYFLLCHFP